MRILGIETSCDETAAAVVENGTKILANVVASSLPLHAKTGGIIPETAAREQVKFIIPVVKEALKVVKEFDALAVTYGPGLVGSLLVGVETAKALAYAWNKPIIPVNHLIGHVYANWLDNPKPPAFPNITLVVSGGHTDLIYFKSHGKYRWLGGTRDDAAGEAFDKTARLLGLAYPGGPEIAQLAEKGNPKAINFPRPMIKQKNYDFSFSGLKTAVSNFLKTNPNFSKEDAAASIQEAIVEVLVTKTLKAAQEFKVKEILISGGVAANQRLKEKMIKEFKGKIQIPPPSLCTDNAAMIAGAAFFNYKQIPWQKVRANPGLHF